jgi:hypothetical protein
MIFLRSLTLGKIAAGLGGLALIGAGVTIYIMSNTIGARTDERDAAREGLAAERKSHGVTLASVVTLKRELEAKNAESLARAAAFEASKAADAKAIAEMDRRQAASDTRIASLRAIAEAAGKVGADGRCRVPAAIANALEGI